MVYSLWRTTVKSKIKISNLKNKNNLLSRMILNRSQNWHINLLMRGWLTNKKWYYRKERIFGSKRFVTLIKFKIKKKVQFYNCMIKSKIYKKIQSQTLRMDYISRKKYHKLSWKFYNQKLWVIAFLWSAKTS